MKYIKLILILLAFIFTSKLSIGQQDKVIIKNIGLLGNNNIMFFDGGMAHLELVIEKCKVRKNKLRLKGKLICKSSQQDIYFYNVYLADYIEADYKLNIKDTLVKSLENKRIKKLSSKFSISTTLKPTEAIYFELMGFGMLEVKIKEDD